MNDNIKNLAAFAGFILWGNEVHNPGDTIDWASRYDEELIKFTTLIVDTALRLKEAGSDPYDYFGVRKEDQPQLEEVALDINGDTLVASMLAAHSKNLTLNKFFEDALIKVINQTRKDDSEDDLQG